MFSRQLSVQVPVLFMHKVCYGNQMGFFFFFWMGFFFFFDLMTPAVIGVLLQRLRAEFGVLCKSKLYGFTTVHLKDM